jgi:hypothetical protein
MLVCDSVQYVVETCGFVVMNRERGIWLGVEKCCVLGDFVVC